MNALTYYIKKSKNDVIVDLYLDHVNSFSSLFMLPFQPFPKVYVLIRVYGLSL